MEVEATDEGTLGKILIPEGTETSRSTRRSRPFWATAKAPPISARRQRQLARQVRTEVAGIRARR